MLLDHILGISWTPVPMFAHCELFGSRIRVPVANTYREKTTCLELVTKVVLKRGVKAHKIASGGGNCSNAYNFKNRPVPQNTFLAI